MPRSQRTFAGHRTTSQTVSDWQVTTEARCSNADQRLNVQYEFSLKCKPRLLHMRQTSLNSNTVKL